MTLGNDDGGLTPREFDRQALWISLAIVAIFALPLALNKVFG